MSGDERAAPRSPAGELLPALGVDPARVARLLAGLRERDQTVATAESLTAGLLCAALTEMPGSSAVVRGGLVVYATELKTRLAGVDAAVIERDGVVSAAVAARLAEGARHACAASWGIGLTGVAGPDPQDGRAPGEVHVALAGASGAPLTRAYTVPGDRHAVRAAAVGAALDLLAECVWRGGGEPVGAPGR